MFILTYFEKCTCNAEISEHIYVFKTGQNAIFKYIPKICQKRPISERELEYLLNEKKENKF